MRGDSNMKRISARTGLFNGLLLCTAFLSTVAGCDPFGLHKGDDDQQNLDAYKGHAAVTWTLNGAPLTAEVCKTERITSMNVFVASRSDRDQNVEFTNVACGIDRYSMAMIPSGSVRVFVDAVRENGSPTPCVRYSGQIDVSAGNAFPTQPSTVALQLVANCP